MPYVPPIGDTTVRYGIGEPYTFYTIDSDPGPARGPWYKPPPPPLPPPHFNQVSCETSSSESDELPGIPRPSVVVLHLRFQLQGTFFSYLIYLIVNEQQLVIQQLYTIECDGCFLTLLRYRFNCRFKT